MKTIGFIGGGRITRIFLQAFKNKNAQFSNICVFDPNSETLQKLAAEFPNISYQTELTPDTVCNEILFLAVHPPVMMETLAKIKPVLKPGTILVSLAPKITIEKMSSALGGFNNIARVNPSATGIINEGINPVAFAEGMNTADRAELLNILGILGKTPVVAESKIEAYAVISAMGSTYFWFQLQQLKDLAGNYGMDSTEADETITEMIKGTVDTLFHSKMTPAQVMDLVPVKPLAEYEESVKGFYKEKLDAIYEKIKP